MKKQLAVLAMLSALVACKHGPIYNVTAHPVPASAQKLTLQKIEETIVQAGQSRGWVFTKTAEGKMRAVQNQPKYGAEVLIGFDAQSYSISYVDSRGMEEKNGIIHDHYNMWIRNLEKDISTFLANATYR